MKNHPPPSYIVVTPVKNEERFIPYLIQSMLEQTVTPKLWVIVDDGSTDRTLDIIKNAQRENKWIVTIILGQSEWDLGIHYSEICIKGFEYAIQYCEDHKLDWRLIGVVDGDIRLPKNYFSNIIERFDANGMLGIASGLLYDIEQRRFTFEDNRTDQPMGGARLWRKECYYDAPYIPVFAPDSISTIKAKLKGWDTRRYEDIIAIQMRPMSSARGFGRGASFRGKWCYHLGCSPQFAFLKGLRLFTKFPFYHGLWFLYGYFTTKLKHLERINDEDILTYYGKIRIQEIKKLYILKLRRMLGMGK